MATLSSRFDKVIKVARFSGLFANGILSPEQYDQLWPESTLKEVLGDYHMKSRTIPEDRSMDATGLPV